MLEIYFDILQKIFFFFFLIKFEKNRRYHLNQYLLSVEAKYFKHESKLIVLTLLCFQYPPSFEANYFKHDIPFIWEPKLVRFKRY